MTATSRNSVRTARKSALRCRRKISAKWPGFAAIWSLGLTGPPPTSFLARNPWHPALDRAKGCDISERFTPAKCPVWHMTQVDLDLTETTPYGLLSVVLPNIHYDRYVSEAIASIAAQTYYTIELSEVEM